MSITVHTIHVKTYTLMQSARVRISESTALSDCWGSGVLNFGTPDPSKSESAGNIEVDRYCLISCGIILLYRKETIFTYRGAETGSSIEVSWILPDNRLGFHHSTIVIFFLLREAAVKERSKEKCLLVQEKILKNSSTERSRGGTSLAASSKVALPAFPPRFNQHIHSGKSSDYLLPLAFACFTSIFSYAPFSGFHILCTHLFVFFAKSVYSKSDTIDSCTGEENPVFSFRDNMPVSHLFYDRGQEF
jgi:hypothetical protein